MKHMTETPDFEVVIPVYNGGKLFQYCLQSIADQNVQPSRILVVDSSSTDSSADLARRAGCKVHTIAKSNFDHGGTRNVALELVTATIVVFLTQDAILHGEGSLKCLLDSFGKEGIAAVYGRQLPHDDADPLAVFTRSKTYPDTSYYCSEDDAHPVGFSKCFMSNSFAAYNVETLRSIGGFPEKLILGEDSYAAARLLIEGHRIGYNAEALVKHSHNYTISQEFRRYFDTGVFHDTQSWMLTRFGSPMSRGKEFALSQVRWLRNTGESQLVVRSVLTSAAKFLGYKLGRNHHRIGTRLSQRLAMHKSYFSSVSQNSSLF